MKKISKFDLGVIIAFVVIGLAGGGACFYLNTQLGAAQNQATAAKSDYEKLSVVAGADQSSIVVGPSSEKVVQGNIDALKNLLTPVIQSRLMPKENVLNSIQRQDPVTWKHNLVDLIHTLTENAKKNRVKLPDNYYFAFSRYISQNPADEQTLVLSKQLKGVEEISNILFDGQVNSIDNISRTYEEGGASATSAPGDMLKGASFKARDGSYTAYPFEIEFNTNTDGFRKVMNGLVQSPYIFIVRDISVENQQPDSPKLDDLAKIVAGNSNGGSPTDILEPGRTAATAAANKGTVYLFGSALLHVKARIDMIEWNGH